MKLLQDSLANINHDIYLHQDSLLKDTINFVQTQQSFFKEDTMVLIPSGFSVQKISEITHEFPIAEDWLAIVVLGIVVYLILSRFLFSFNLQESIKGIGKIQSLDMVSFEKETRFTGYILTPLAVFVYSFYLYFFINPLYLHFKLDFLFAVFALVIILLFLVRIAIEKGISLVFNTPRVFYQYFSDHLFILGVSSLIQVPILIIYIYSGIHSFLWISLGILLLFWIFRLLRGLIIGINQTSFSKSFIILYLCSLEILPIIIALKLIIG